MKILQQFSEQGLSVGSFLEKIIIEGVKGLQDLSQMSGRVPDTLIEDLGSHVMGLHLSSVGLGGNSVSNLSHLLKTALGVSSSHPNYPQIKGCLHGLLQAIEAQKYPEVESMFNSPGMVASTICRSLDCIREREGSIRNVVQLGSLGENSALQLRRVLSLEGVNNSNSMVIDLFPPHNHSLELEWYKEDLLGDLVWKEVSNTIAKRSDGGATLLVAENLLGKLVGNDNESLEQSNDRQSQGYILQKISELPREVYFLIIDLKQNLKGLAVPSSLSLIESADSVRFERSIDMFRYLLDGTIQPSTLSKSPLEGYLLLRKNDES